MSLRLQLVIAFMDILAFAWIVNMIRKNKIDLRYALSWLFSLVILLILDAFPVIVYKMADLIGIDTPSNMVFFVGFLIFIVLIYTSTASISHLSNKTKKLTQELALLKKQLDDMQADDSTEREV